MHVICYAADSFRSATGFMEATPKISMKTISPFGSDAWLAMLRGIDRMDVERKMGRTHGAIIPAACRDAVEFFVIPRGFSLVLTRSTPGYRSVHPSRDAVHSGLFDPQETSA